MPESSRTSTGGNGAVDDMIEQRLSPAGGAVIAGFNRRPRCPRQ